MVCGDAAPNARRLPPNASRSDAGPTSYATGSNLSPLTLGRTKRKNDRSPQILKG
jgi:hypothetical protein